MKAIITILTILITLSSQAQDTLRIPAPVAKQIVKDLISGDSAKAELNIVQQQLELSQQIIEVKNGIISTYSQKCKIYDESIRIEKLKFEAQDIYIQQLKKFDKKSKAKLTRTKILSGIILGALGYLYIIK